MIAPAKILAGEVAIAVSLHVEKALKGVKALEAKLGQVLDRLQSRISALSTATLSLAAAFSGAVTAAVTFGDATAKMARRLGLSTEELTAFRYAAESLGASGQNMDEALRIMTRRVGEFQMGTGEAKKAFEALGISVEDLSGKSAAEQFELIRDRLSQVESSTQRAALAAKIFDTNWAPLAPLLAMTGKEFQGLVEQADQMGQTLDSEVARQSEDVAQAVGEMTTALKLVTVQIGAMLLPVVRQLRDMATRLAGLFRRLAQAGGGVWRVLGRLAVVLVGVAAAVKVLAAAWAVLQVAMGPWGLLIMGIVAALTALWHAFDYFTGKTEEASETTVDFSKALERAETAGRRLGRTLREQVAQALEEVDRRFQPAIEAAEKMFKQLDRFSESNAKDVAQLLVDLDRLRRQVGDARFQQALYRVGLSRLEVSPTGRLNTSRDQLQALVAELAGELRLQKARTGEREVARLREEMIRRQRAAQALETQLPGFLRNFRPGGQAKVDLSDVEVQRAILQARRLLPEEIRLQAGKYIDEGLEKYLEFLLQQTVSYRERLNAEARAAQQAYLDARRQQQKRLQAEQAQVQQMWMHLRDRRRVEALQRRFEQVRARQQRLVQDRQAAAELAEQLRQKLEEQRLQRLPRHEQERIRAQREFNQTVRQISRLQISRQQREALIQRAQAVLAERLRQIDQNRQNQAQPPAARDFINRLNRMMRDWWLQNRNRLRNLPRAVRQRHILWARLLAFERVFNQFGATQAAVLSGSGAAALAGRMGRAKDNPLWEMLDVLRVISGLAGLQEGHLRFIRKKLQNRFR